MTYTMFTAVVSSQHVKYFQKYCVEITINPSHSNQFTQGDGNNCVGSEVPVDEFEQIHSSLRKQNIQDCHIIGNKCSFIQGRV